MCTHKQRGVSLIETAIVVSILSSLAILTAPTIAKSKRDMNVLQCKEQMHEIGVALIKFRNDHRGKMPESLADLIPQNLAEDRLICPFTKAVAPEVVEKWAKYMAVPNGTRAATKWSTYQYFQPDQLDRLAKKFPDIQPLGFTEVLRTRGGETPMVICRNHREPLCFDPYLGYRHGTHPHPALPSLLFPYPLWDYPEDPIVILRWEGTVGTSLKGGTYLHSTFNSTLSDLLDL